MASPEVDGVLTLGLTSGRRGSSSRPDPTMGRDTSLAQTQLQNFGIFLNDTIRLRNQYQKPIVVVTSIPIRSEEMVAKLAALTRDTQTSYYMAAHRAAAAYAALAKYAQYLRENS